MAAIGSALRVARSSMAKGERQVVSGHSSPGDRELAHNEAASPDGRDFRQPRIALRGGRARDERVRRWTDALERGVRGPAPVIEAL